MQLPDSLPHIGLVATTRTGTAVGSSPDSRSCGGDSGQIMIKLPRICGYFGVESCGRIVRYQWNLHQDPLSNARKPATLRLKIEGPRSSAISALIPRTSPLLHYADICFVGLVCIRHELLGFFLPYIV